MMMSSLGLSGIAMSNDAAMPLRAMATSAKAEAEPQDVTL